MNSSTMHLLRVLLISATFVFLCLPTTAGAQAQSINIDAAKKEGRIVLYGTVPSQSMDVFNKGFERKYGIKVDYWRAASTKIMDRVLAEWRSGRPGFDIIEGTQAAQLILKKEGFFIRYVPSGSEKFPEQFKDKEGIMTPWRILPFSILYNTELVKPADVPKTLDHLLNPRWKKKISIPDPSRHTTTAELLRNLEKVKGEKWLDFVKALAKQQPHMVESFAPVPDVLIRGEAEVGITFIKYLKQFKGPIDYVLMDKHLAYPSYFTLSAKAASPNAAKLYLDYAASPEAQKAMAEKEGEFVLYPGIYPPIRDADKVVERTIFMDPPTAEEFKQLSSLFRDIFFGK